MNVDKKEDTKVKVLNFTKEFPGLSKDLLKTRPQAYDYLVIMTLTIELERGMKVIKVNKPTKSGTIMKFIPLKQFNSDGSPCTKDVLDYIVFINNKIQTFNKLYEKVIKAPLDLLLIDQESLDNLVPEESNHDK